MLPDGSELKGVMLPRYDEDHKLIGVLKSQTMPLVNAGQIDGQTVSIELFNPDQSPKGRIDLISATFYQEKGHPHRQGARRNQIRPDDRQRQRPLLLVQTRKGISARSRPPPSSSPHRELHENSLPHRFAPRLFSAWRCWRIPAAAPPQPVTAEESAALQADAMSKAPPKSTPSNAAAKTRLETDLATPPRHPRPSPISSSRRISPPSRRTPNRPRKPLEVKNGPNDTIINCTGGMYFDADAGVLVYLKNVHRQRSPLRPHRRGRTEDLLRKKAGRAEKRRLKPEKPADKKNPGSAATSARSSAMSSASSPPARSGSTRSRARQGTDQSQRRDLHLQSQGRRDHPQPRLPLVHPGLHLHAGQGAEPLPEDLPEDRQLLHRRKLGNGRKHRTEEQTARPNTTPDAQSRLDLLQHGFRRALRQRTPQDLQRPLRGRWRLHHRPAAGNRRPARP